MKRVPECDASQSGMARRTAGVALLAGLSKVAGLARDMLLAAMLGASGTADAVFLAFQLPNLFRRAFGDGVLNGVLVPELVRAGKISPQAPDMLLTRWVVRVGLVSLIGGLLLVWFPEVPAQLLARTGAERVAELLRLMAGYLVFISIAVVFKAWYEHMGVFSWPAAMPLAFNLVVMTGMAAWWQKGWPVANGFAIGVVAGGLVQAGLLVLVARRLGWRPRISTGLSLPELPVLKRVLPLAVAAGVFQLNLVVSRLVASGLQPGSVAVLDYASRLLEVTLGVAAFPLATVLLPELSSRAADRDRSGAGEGMTRGLAMLLLVTVPATVGLIQLREPIVRLLFERGAFHGAAVRMTAGTVGWFAAGLVAFGAARLLLQEPFSRSDVKLPMVATLVAVTVNAVAAVWLAPTMGVAGVAAAGSLAAVAATFLLLAVVRRSCPLDWGRLSGLGFRVLLAAAVMGVVLDRLNGGTGPWTVVGHILLGIAVYGGTLWTVAGRAYRNWMVSMWRKTA